MKQTICLVCLLLVPTVWAQDAEVRKAISELRPKADGGDARSQFTLGMLYDPMFGGRDSAEAIRWYIKAAEQGFVQAQISLGGIYKNGRGVPKDYGEAAKWYGMAAGQDYTPAQRSLGDLYKDRRDYREAAKWYRLAADRGDASAQFSLASMYIDGQGVPKDDVLAYVWLNLAGVQTSLEPFRKTISELRDTLEAMMTPQQIAEAQSLAREWKPIPAK